MVAEKFENNGTKSTPNLQLSKHLPLTKIWNRPINLCVFVSEIFLIKNDTQFYHFVIAIMFSASYFLVNIQKL